MPNLRGLMGGRRQNSDTPWVTDCFPPYDEPTGPFGMPLGTSFGAPRKEGFDWGRAAAAFVGGKGVAEMFERRDAARFAEEERRRLRAMAGQVIKDPAEWTAFEVSPEAWAKARLGQRFEAPEPSPEPVNFVEGQEGDGRYGSSLQPLPPGWIKDEEDERARREGRFGYFRRPNP